MATPEMLEDLEVSYLVEVESSEPTTSNYTQAAKAILFVMVIPAFKWAVGSGSEWSASLLLLGITAAVFAWMGHRQSISYARVSVLLGDEGLLILHPARTHELSWETLSLFEETNAVFRLFDRAGEQVRAIPKRGMDQSEVAALRRYLSSKLAEDAALRFE